MSPAVKIKVQGVCVCGGQGNKDDATPEIFISEVLQYVRHRDSFLRRCVVLCISVCWPSPH